MVDYLGRINVSMPVGLAWPKPADAAQGPPRRAGVAPLPSRKRVEKGGAAKPLGGMSFASSAVHAQQLAGGFVVGFGGLQQAHLLLELARGGDHADHAFDRVHV